MGLGGQRKCHCFHLLDNKPLKMRNATKRTGGGSLSLPLVFLVVWIILFFLGWSALLHVQLMSSSSSSSSKIALTTRTEQQHQQQQQSSYLPPSAPILLTSPESGTRAFADVKGNLGDASVVLQNQTDKWLKDRWQAASNMHGTAIRGQHRIHVVFQQGRHVRVQRFLLDWETAYAEDYRIEGWYQNQTVATYFDAQNEQDQRMRTSYSFGKSPGVKQKLPLHIIHEIDCTLSSSSATSTKTTDC